MGLAECDGLKLWERHFLWTCIVCNKRVCVCLIYDTLHTVNFQAAQKDFTARETKSQLFVKNSTPTDRAVYGLQL